MPAAEPADTGREIQAALDDAPDLDARRVTVAVEDARVVLRGWVPSHEQAATALHVAEEVTDVAVVEELQVDPGLREGSSAHRASEPVAPAEDEVLVGDTDMLAGSATAPEDDAGRAYDENVPWDPPERPVMPPTAAEQAQVAGTTRGEGGGTLDAGEPGAAAADLSAADLERVARGVSPPSTAPEGTEPSTTGAGPPGGVDSAGRAPDDETERDHMPRRVPGTRAGPGAVGESTLGGGTTGGTVATETGAAGADAEEADPARQTGGTSGGTGTDRGPEAEEDRAIRDDLPHRSDDGAR